MERIHTGGTLAGAIINAIKRFPDRPCLADDRLRWTYRELGEAMARAISVYKAHGLKPGEGASALSSNRIDVLGATLGAVAMGLRYTPLHPLAAEPDQAFVIDDAEISALIVDPIAFEERGRRIAENAKTVRHVFSLGPMKGAVDLHAEGARLGPAPLVAEVDAEQLAYIAYTGGTTGRSKGVMHKQRGLLTAVNHMLADWDWPAEIRFLACTPISHAAGACLYPVFVRGGYVRLTSFDPNRFCELVEAEKINTTLMVPTMIYVILDHPARQSRDLSSLETIIYGASPMSPERLAEAIGVFGPVFQQLYGLTEAPNVVTSLRKVDHDLSRPERLSSCGLPSLLVDVALFDPDMKPVGDGEPGEICVRGPLVMEGYWKRPEETEEAFRGGWFHTGDVAVRDADGYLTIVDRAKDMIVTGGFNVYPREVEDALLAHPAVSGAAVIGAPDPKWGEQVMAFVVLRPGEAASEAELIAHVKALKGGPWAPKSVEFVEAIPVTGLGKIDRKALRAKYWKEGERQVG